MGRLTVCVAVPGRVVSLSRDGVVVTGVADFGGRRLDVNFTFLPDTEVGDLVIVHSGFAIARSADEGSPPDEPSRGHEPLRRRPPLTPN